MPSTKPKQEDGPMLPTSAEAAAEQARMERLNLICDLFGCDESSLRERLELGSNELHREIGVRERCFPNWIAQGKLSRIDANTRFTQLKKAMEIVDYLLDIAGKHVTMTTDDVPF
jgi:hypothetical protein